MRFCKIILGAALLLVFPVFADEFDDLRARFKARLDAGYFGEDTRDANNVYLVLARKRAPGRDTSINAAYLLMGQTQGETGQEQIWADIRAWMTLSEQSVSSTDKHVRSEDAVDIGRGYMMLVLKKQFTGPSDEMTYHTNRAIEWLEAATRKCTIDGVEAYFLLGEFHLKIAELTNEAAKHVPIAIENLAHATYYPEALLHLAKLHLAGNQTPQDFGKAAGYLWHFVSGDDDYKPSAGLPSSVNAKKLDYVEKRRKRIAPDLYSDALDLFIGMAKKKQGGLTTANPWMAEIERINTPAPSAKKKRRVEA